VYVDDINIIVTFKELPRAINCLKKKFEVQKLGKRKFFLGLEIEHLNNEIFMHQKSYVAKVLKSFNMNKSHLLSTSMVVRSNHVEKDPFRPREEDEQILDPEVPYLSPIEALMYLTNCTRLDISF